MARFTLTIDLANAAFSDGERAEELARILQETARRIRNDTEAMGFSFAVQDYNGNTVGRAELLEKEATRAFENIIEWANSRDGSPEADDNALTAIIEIAAKMLGAS